MMSFDKFRSLILLDDNVSFSDFYSYMSEAGT